jgi:hypothetical protein
LGTGVSAGCCLFPAWVPLRSSRAALVG